MDGFHPDVKKKKMGSKISIRKVRGVLFKENEIVLENLCGAGQTVVPIEGFLLSMQQQYYQNSEEPRKLQKVHA